MKTKIKNLVEQIFRLSLALEVLFLSGMVAVVLWQVFSRIFLNRTPGWSEELAQLLTIWFGFIGSAILVREKGHIALEFVVQRLNEKAQRIIEWVVAGLIFLFSIYLCWGGLDLVRSTIQNHLPGTHLPVGVAYLPIPISGFLMLLALIFPRPVSDGGEQRC